MKLIGILSTVFLLVTAGPAMAQYGGYVGVYTNYPGITDCALYEAVGQINSVWVVDKSAEERSRARFQITTDWNATLLPTDYRGNFVVSGDVYTGVEVSYASYANPSVPGCAPPPVIIAELRFMPMSATPCGPTIVVAPHPEAASGMIEVMDCSSNVFTAPPGDPVLINGSQYQVDPPGVAMCWCDVVRTESTTWGAIKSLYR